MATFADLERARTTVLGSAVRMRIATQAALVHTLQGNLPVAERWLQDARIRLAKNKDDRLGHAAHLCLADAVLAARKGDYEGAIARLDARWLELRYSFTADLFRVAEVVRSFAETQRGMRNANAAGERLIRIEPVLKGEFAFLGVAWPQRNSQKRYLVDSQGRSFAQPTRLRLPSRRTRVESLAARACRQQGHGRLCRHHNVATTADAQ